MLFVQGGCDEEYANVQELQAVLDGLGSRASLHIVEGADHSYDLPAESGKTRLDALSEVASVTAAWIQRTLKDKEAGLLHRMKLLPISSLHHSRLLQCSPLLSAVEPAWISTATRTTGGFAK